MRIRKRSVTLAGHRTSVSVEDAFWDELKAIADAEGRTVAEILTELDAGRAGNLSSAVRLFVLAALKREAASDPITPVAAVGARAPRGRSP